MADTITKWSESFMTNNGLALRQKSIALGLEVVFTHGQIGEGVPTKLSQIPLMTSLVHFSQQVQLARSLSIGPTHHIDLKIDNMNFPASVLMRELAIFAKLKEPEDPIDDPELAAFLVPTLYEYAYCLTGYESVPAGADFHRIWSVGVDTQISRSAAISMLYDGSFTYVSYADFEAVAQMANAAMLLAQSLADHVGEGVSSEKGVHGLRYWKRKWQVEDGDGEWETTTGGSTDPGDEPSDSGFRIDGKTLWNANSFGTIIQTDRSNTLEFNPGIALMIGSVLNLGSADTETVVDGALLNDDMEPVEGAILAEDGSIMRLSLSV